MISRSNTVNSLILLLALIGQASFSEPTRRSPLPTIAVTELDVKGFDQDQKKLLIDALISKLQSTQIYTVIERNQMSEILKEQGFQQSGACDQTECAIEVGKLLGAQKLVIGSLGIFPGIINTNLRVIDVTTGAIEKSYSDTRRGDFASLLLEVIPASASKLCGIGDNAESLGSFVLDSRDSKVYKTFKLNKTTWMAENLNFNSEKSLCYNNDTANCSRYGRLYNAKEALEACPRGWHLATDDEWIELEIEAGMKQSDYNNMFTSRGTFAAKLMSTTGWNKSKSPSGGTDDFGFKCLPSGAALKPSKFVYIDEFAWHWSTGSKQNTLCFRQILPVTYNVTRFCGELLEGKGLFSIRCVQNQN